MSKNNAPMQMEQAVNPNHHLKKANPFILLITRPKANSIEAYWVSFKNYY